MTRSVVTLQKLFANQTNVFNIKLDKEVFLLPSRLKYSLGSPMFFWTQPWWKILTEGWPKCWPASSCLVARGRLPECKETFLFIHAFSTVFSRLPVPSNYKQSFQDFAFSMFFFNFCVHFVYCWIVFNFFYRYHFSLLSFIFHFFTVHLFQLSFFIIAESKNVGLPQGCFNLDGRRNIFLSSSIINTFFLLAKSL